MAVCYGVMVFVSWRNVQKRIMMASRCPPPVRELPTRDYTSPKVGATDICLEPRVYVRIELSGRLGILSNLSITNIYSKWVECLNFERNEKYIAYI